MDELRRALSNFPLLNQVWAAGEPVPGLKHRDAIKSLHKMDLTAPFRPAPAEESKASVYRYNRSDFFRSLNSSELIPFAEWTLGLGLYQKHLWPVLVRAAVLRATFSNPTLHGSPSASDLRSSGKFVLQELIADFPRFAGYLVDEMAYSDDLDSEVILWRSHVELLEEAGAISVRAMRFAEEEAAVRHGFRDWSELLGSVTQDQIYGAIPFPLIVTAVTKRARVLSLAWSRGGQY